MDVDGLLAYFEQVRRAFDNRTITRGVIIAEGSNMACQTRIEGDFVREFPATPVGPLARTGSGSPSICTTSSGSTTTGGSSWTLAIDQKVADYRMAAAT